MSYWIITKDRINTDVGEPTRVGFGFIKGLFPGEDDRHRTVNLNSDVVKDWVKSLPCCIKLYDDDGNLYYEGFSSEADFDAQDWAEHNDGVTYTMTKRRKDTAWEML